MTPELLNAIFNGSVLLLGGVATVLTAKSARDATGLRALRAEIKARREQERKFMRWSGAVLRWADFHGHTLPDAPEGLFDDLAVDDEQAAPAVDPDRGGSHRAP